MMLDNTFKDAAALHRMLRKMSASWSNIIFIAVMFAAEAALYLTDVSNAEVLLPMLAAAVTAWWIMLSLSRVGVHYKMIEVMSVTKRTIADYMVYTGEQVIYIQLAASVAAAALFADDPYSMISAGVCFVLMLAVYYLFADRIVVYSVRMAESVMSSLAEFGPITAMCIIFVIINVSVNLLMPLIGIPMGRTAAIVLLIIAWLMLMACRKKVVKAVEKKMLF